MAICLKKNLAKEKKYIKSLSVSQKLSTFAFAIWVSNIVVIHFAQAQMAESVDALVSNTSGAIRAGSIPALGTINPL